MKGMILAGGSGTRLSPSTHSINKHLLAVLTGLQNTVEGYVKKWNHITL